MCKIYFKFVFPAWKQQFLQGLSVKAQWGIQLNTVIFQTLKFYVEFNLTLLLISHDVNHLSSRQSKLQTLLLECIYSLKSLHFLKFSLLRGVRGPALFPNLYPNLKSSDKDNKPSPWSNVSVRTEDERVVIKSRGGNSCERIQLFLQIYILILWAIHVVSEAFQFSGPYRTGMRVTSYGRKNIPYREVPRVKEWEITEFPVILWVKGKRRGREGNLSILRSDFPSEDESKQTEGAADSRALLCSGCLL